MNVAVVGATGAVGNEMVATLEEEMKKLTLLCISTYISKTLTLKRRNP